MNDVLFRLRLRPFNNCPSIGIECVYRGLKGEGINRKDRYSLQVTYKRKRVFEHDGVLVGSFSPVHSIDGKEARRHAVSHVATRPGDTDEDFFKDYTPEQLEFVSEFGEALSLYDDTSC